MKVQTLLILLFFSISFIYAQQQVSKPNKIKLLKTKQQTHHSSQILLRLLNIERNLSQKHENLIFLALGKHIYCYDGINGEVIWKKQLGWSVRKVSFVNDTMIIDKNNSVYSVNPDNGSILWHYPVENRFIDLQPGNNTLGIISYNSSNSKITVLDPQNGNVRWTKSFSAQEPASLIIGENVVAAYSIYPSQTYIYDIVTGNNIHNFKSSTPIIKNNCLYMLKENRWIECYQISSLKKMWSYDAKIINYYSFLVGKHNILCAKQNTDLVAIDGASGATKWILKAPKEGRGIYKKIIDGDVIYILEKNATGINLRALNFESGTVSWTVPFPNHAHIKIRTTEKHLYVLKNRYDDGWVASLTKLDKTTGRKLYYHDVDAGNGGKAITRIHMLADHFWLIKDNSIWIFKK